jgi:hypothetical protein
MRNPFAELPLVERLLVAESIGDDRASVSMLDKDWMKQVSEQLAAGSTSNAYLSGNWARKSCYGPQRVGNQSD